eukprot:365122-Chlamydomonas_euryale.AAC.5
MAGRLRVAQGPPCIALDEQVRFTCWLGHSCSHRGTLLWPELSTHRRHTLLNAGCTGGTTANGASLTGEHAGVPCAAILAPVDFSTRVWSARERITLAWRSWRRF